MTQNEAFIALPGTWTIPETSAHAKVVNTNFTATLTSRPVKELALTAQYKYEDRDNKTPSMNFTIAGGNATDTPSLFTNRPLDFRTNQFSADANYSVAPRQTVRLAYEWKQVTRTVNATPPPPAELESPFDAERTTENTVRAEYWNTFSSMASGRLSYAYSQRRSSEYEGAQLLPTPTVAPFPAADPGLPTFQQFWLADRNRDKVRGVLNLQATDQLGVQSSVEYVRDTYKDLMFGLKNVRSLAFNVDAGYAASERMTFNAFYTYEDKKSALDSLVIGRGSAATILDPPAFTAPCSGYFAASGHLPSDLGTDPCRQWAEAQSDRVHTIGLGGKLTGLIDDKFDLTADLTYSRARTPISVSGGAYFGNGSTAVAPAFNNIYIPAQNFQDITSNYVQLRLNGIYALDRRSAVRLLYVYGHLKSSDWQWDAYTNSSLGVLAIPTLPGTGMTSPNYNVSEIGVSYIYRFR
jgi:MtrB/PioB family decaheme-associated outer membrane protein